MAGGRTMTAASAPDVGSSPAARPAGRVRGRTPKVEGAPHGPDQVRRATLDAATELFLAHGISGVSARQIAEHARVHPALVRRYVGNKEVVVRAVLAELRAGVTDQLDAFALDTSEDATPLPRATLDRYFRLILQLNVDGRDLSDYQPDFPVVHRVVEVIERRNGVSTTEARRRGAQIVTLELATLIFGPALLAAAGLDPDDPDDTEELHRLVRHVSLSIGSGRIAE